MSDSRIPWIVLKCSVLSWIYLVKKNNQKFFTILKLFARQSILLFCAEIPMKPIFAVRLVCLTRTKTITKNAQLTNLQSKVEKKFAILMFWWDLHIYEHFSSWTHLKCGQTGSMKAPFVNFESNATAFHNLNWKVAMKSTSSKESKMEVLTRIRGNLINENKDKYSFRLSNHVK